MQHIPAPALNLLQAWKPIKLHWRKQQSRRNDVRRRQKYHRFSTTRLLLIWLIQIKWFLCQQSNHFLFFKKGYSWLHNNILTCSRGDRSNYVEWFFNGVPCCLCVFTCGREAGKKTRKELRESKRKRGEEGEERATDRKWEKYGDCKQRQTLCRSQTFIMSVSLVAGSQNAVGDLSQSAEKPRALPEAWFTQQKDISPCVTWTALSFCLSKFCQVYVAADAKKEIFL